MQAPELDVPVYLCLGRYDYEVPSALAAAYFDALEAPRSNCVGSKTPRTCPFTKSAMPSIAS